MVSLSRTREGLPRNGPMETSKRIWISCAIVSIGLMFPVSAQASSRRWPGSTTHAGASARNVLTRPARDPEYRVRRRSVAGLVRLDDPKSIAIVEDLARNDAYVDTLPGREGTYPVREPAEKALRSRRPR